MKTFESLGSLEIKWKLFLKTDGMLLSLGSMYCPILCIVGLYFRGTILQRFDSIHFCYLLHYLFKFIFMEATFYKLFRQDFVVKQRNKRLSGMNSPLDIFFRTWDGWQDEVFLGRSENLLY